MSSGEVFLEEAEEIFLSSFEDGSHKKENSVLVQRLLQICVFCEISARTWKKLDSHIDFKYKVSGLLILLPVVSDVHLAICRGKRKSI